MAPARNLLRRYYDSYGGSLFLDPARWEEIKVSVPLGLMADQEARQEAAQEEEEEAAAAAAANTTTTNTKVDIGVDDDQSSKGSSWLQLGPSRPAVELNLFPDTPTTTAGAAALGNVRPTTTTTIASQGSGRLTYTQPGSSSFSGRELRVISPPRGRRTGLWFELKAARDQGKEPFLPQIPKSYLRIKDESMTVGLLMKYLANKLGLDGESQVEIACRGQRLHPMVKLQQIRDNMLRTRSTAPMMPQDLQISDHVMTLIYCRRA